jgi:Helix-turn-helix domain
MLSSTESLAVSVPEAARRVGISRALAFREIKKGKLVATKIAGRTVVQLRDLQAWLDAGRAVAA